ncbi:uncharacterized protein LOC114728276 [Neltuma alba]|uniref:uncharacterized protein LOC114728276 n=1 Tax=Neltuma alba TaxID=207710 RepID=UPI0010A3444E|nr:uncharacterized protein LOC114728276 [Prosopis alba]XP_028770989.1 uncharacterized protein LOC114728276 [Prosopis alba]
MPRKTSCRASKKPGNDSNLTFPSSEKDCYEGERLTNLLQLIHREIGSARTADGNSLPEKIWLKQKFSVGVNDVTRVLERMPPCTESRSSSQLSPLISCNNRTSSVKLQVVLVASDCNPRWLIKHLPSLASSRKVPLIFVRDNKKGSLRLGELVNLRTAIAVGIKARENRINKLLEKIIQQDGVEPDCPKSAETSDARDVQEPDVKVDMP